VSRFTFEGIATIRCHRAGREISDDISESDTADGSEPASQSAAGHRNARLGGHRAARRRAGRRVGRRASSMTQMEVVSRETPTRPPTGSQQTPRWRKPDSNLRYRGRCRRSGRSPCLDRADSGRSRLRNRTAGVDPFEPFLASEHRAKTAIRRRLAHIAPSSLCGRLAGRCPAEMRGEKGARLPSASLAAGSLYSSQLPR